MLYYSDFNHINPARECQGRQGAKEDDRMQPHIHLNEGLGIRCAILPGDPARVERIAAYLDDVCDHGSHREYRSISGT